MKEMAVKLLALLMVMPLMLAGCSGGGSDNVVSQGGGVTTGVAVDPYIMGAVFIEVDASGNLVQPPSSPSDINGAFSFTKALQSGSVVIMQTQGMHGGTPFKGILRRNVDISDGTLVVSPLTTLLAVYEDNGQDADDLIADIAQDLPADSPLSSLTVADLTADPMAAIVENAEVTVDAAEKLAAAMAINTALATLGEDSNDILVAADAVADTLTATLFIDDDNNGFVDPLQIDDDNNVSTPPVDATMVDMVSAAVAVNNYLVSDFEAQVLLADTPDQLPTASDLNVTAIDAGLASDLVETAADPANEGGAVAIDGSSGTPTAAVPPGSIAEYLNTAFAAWELGETEIDQAGGFNTAYFLEAVENFQAAAALVGIDANVSQADQDKALFFGGLSGLLALANPYSDLTDDGLNNLGDLLDAFGIDTAGRDDLDAIAVEQCADVFDPGTGDFLYQDCQMAPLAVDSPTSADLQQFMAGKVGAALQGVISKLGQVSSGFNYVHIDAGPMAAGSGTEFDYADAKFIQGVANGMLAQVEIFQAYEHNVDIDDEQAKSDNLDIVDTTEDFLARQDVNIAGGSFGSLKEAAVSGPLLASAKDHISAASDSLVAAIDAIKIEADAGEGQMDDLISFYSESCTWFDDGNGGYTSCGYDAQQTALDIDETRSIFVEVKQGLSAPIIDDNGTADTSDDVTIHAYKFFDGISLRDKMPTFTGDQPDGGFPDATMGGILDPAQMNINEDFDGDGIPDLFDGYTRFFTDLISGQEAAAHFWWMDGEADESFAFDANGTFQYSLYVYDYQGGAPTNTSETGTWEIDTVGDLVLSFDASVVSWRSNQSIDRMVIDLLGSWYDGEGLQVKIDFFNGVNVDPSEPQGDADWNLWPAI